MKKIKRMLLLSLVLTMVFSTTAIAAPSKQDTANMKLFTKYLESTILLDYDAFVSTVKGPNTESLKDTFDSKRAYYNNNQTVVFYKFTSMKRDTKHKVSKTYGTPYSVVYFQAEVDTVNMTSLRLTKITGGSYIKVVKGKPYVTNDLPYSGENVTWDKTPAGFRQSFEEYVRSAIGGDYTSPDNPTGK